MPFKEHIKKTEAVKKAIDTLIAFGEFQEACCGVTPKVIGLPLKISEEIF